MAVAISGLERGGPSVSGVEHDLLVEALRRAPRDHALHRYRTGPISTPPGNPTGR
jgi:hypothetical protein